MTATTATGQVTYTDADTSDTHTLSVSVAAAHGTATVDPNGTWHYTVSDTGAVDALAVGEHLADSFTVKVDDGHDGDGSGHLHRCRHLGHPYALGERRGSLRHGHRRSGWHLALHGERYRCG